jgi:HEAT repeat protein
MRRAAAAVFASVLLTLSAAGIGAQDTSEEKPIAPLLEALREPQPEARLKALQAIEKLGPQAVEAIPALVDTLGDGEAEVRAAAAGALGAIGPAAESAIPALIKALADRGIVIRVEDGLPKQVPVWAVVGSALGRIGPAALPDLIPLLAGENLQMCGGAAQAIHVIGPEAKEAVGPLLELLAKDEPFTRRAAIYALMGIGPEAKAAVPALTEALTHEDFHTQYWACRALREIGPEAQSSVPVLLKLLREGLPSNPRYAASVRRHAAQALGGIGPGIGTEARDALAEALKDPIDPVREDAAIALGKLGPFAKPAVPALEEALDKGPFSARVRAAKSLWLITGETERAVDVLIGELGDFNWGLLAAQVLGEIGPQANKAVPRLVELFQAVDPYQRVAAADALLRIDPESKVAVPALKELLDHEDEEIRQAAVELLKHLAPDAPPAKSSP